jgi:hypothetical protein
VAVLAQRSQDSDYKAKIAVWLRLSHKFLSEIYDFWIDLQDTHNFTTANGTENYPMPQRFDKPLRVYDLTNNREILPEVEEKYFDDNVSAIADSTTGKPSKYRLFGSTGVIVPISTNGDTLQVKSSSSSDTTSPVVRIRGYIDLARLIEDFEDITISASSPTTFVAGTKTFFEITHVSKSANTTGFITIANSSSTTLETLAPNNRLARHTIMKLGLIPDGSFSTRVLFKKTISEMDDDDDYSFTDSDRYLTFDAFGYALKQDKEDTRANFAWQKAEEALRVLLSSQGLKLGPKLQNRIVSTWLKDHRNRI